jgi:hypothetical protein
MSDLLDWENECVCKRNRKHESKGQCEQLHEVYRVGVKERLEESGSSRDRGASAGKTRRKDRMQSTASTTAGAGSRQGLQKAGDLEQLIGVCSRALIVI